MQRTVRIGNYTIHYELEIKPVKNINLRIRPDGSIHVSANRRHSIRQIEELFASNAKMILRAMDHAAVLRENASEIRQVSREQEGKEAEKVVEEYCRKYYPFFSHSCGGQMPEIRYRRMRSRWGSCAPKKRVLTFNTRLAYVPERCVEYVVVHEFCHFLFADHSSRFYEAVSSCLPDWKMRRAELRTYEGLMA